eukprot:SAG31_NODE_1363_length_8627_cov_5.967402_8_plen_153_part_00
MCGESEVGDHEELSNDPTDGDHARHIDNRYASTTTSSYSGDSSTGPGQPGHTPSAAMLHRVSAGNGERLSFSQHQQSHSSSATDSIGGGNAIGFVGESDGSILQEALQVYGQQQLYQGQRLPAAGPGGASHSNTADDSENTGQFERYDLLIY